jgi:hypothetical protein
MVFNGLGLGLKVKSSCFKRFRFSVEGKGFRA